MPRIPLHDEPADDDELQFDRNDDYRELQFSPANDDEFSEAGEFDDSDYFTQEEDC